MNINNPTYNESLNYKVKTYLESYKMFQKTLSSDDQSITKNEILTCLEITTNEKETRAIDKIIERQVARFRVIFGFDKKNFSYNRTTNKYVLASINQTSFPHFKMLYDYLNTIVLSSRIGANPTNISNVLLSDKSEEYVKTNLIFKLIDAITNRKTICFSHHNHYTNEVIKHEVEPWFIKHFEGKYFLGCYRRIKGEVIDEGYRHYTTNQIIESSLRVLNKDIDLAFKLNNFPEIEHNIFDQCIGIRISKENNPSELCTKADIIIETNYTVGKNWIKKPIHHKQVCLSEGLNLNDTFTFKLPNFYFNITLKELILKNHNKIKVIHPPEVIEELKRDINRLIKVYD